MKKKRRKVSKKISRENSVGGSFGILGFILTIFIGDLASKNVNENLNFSPLEIAESLGAGLQLITGLPRIFSVILGWILLFVPAVFFYFIGKWTYRKL